MVKTINGLVRNINSAVRNANGQKVSLYWDGEFNTALQGDLPVNAEYLVQFGDVISGVLLKNVLFQIILTDGHSDECKSAIKAIVNC